MFLFMNFTTHIELTLKRTSARFELISIFHVLEYISFSFFRTTPVLLIVIALLRTSQTQRTGANNVSLMLTQTPGPNGKVK